MKTNTETKTLPRYTNVGSYPILYLTPTNDCLCADCATEETEEPVQGHINYETPTTCDECGDDIEAAYPTE